MRGIRILADTSLALALGSLGFGIVASRLPAGGAAPTSPPATRAEQPVLTATSVTLGEVRPLSKVEFAVVITNDGVVPARLIGAPSLCVKVGCVSALDVPTTIPAGESRSIRFRFVGYNPGPVALTVAIHFDVATGSIVTVPVRLTGMVAGPPR